MGFLGMNVSAATGAKLTVAQTSGAIVEMASGIVNYVQNLRDGGKWIGEDAKNFFDEEFPQFAPLAKSATDKLTPQAQALARRIQRQQEASA